MNILHHFKQGILNLINYFLPIWNNREYDEHFIYALLYRKLEMKEQFFRSDNARTLESEKTADEIKLVKDALKRLIDDLYLNEEMVEYDEKYGHLDMFCFENVKDKPYRRRVEKRPKEAVEMFNAACERSRQKEIEDREFVFNYMRDNITGWWD